MNNFLSHAYPCSLCNTLIAHMFTLHRCKITYRAMFLAALNYTNQFYFKTRQLCDITPGLPGQRDFFLVRYNFTNFTIFEACDKKNLTLIVMLYNILNSFRKLFLRSPEARLIIVFLNSFMLHDNSC